MRYWSLDVYSNGCKLYFIWIVNIPAGVELVLFLCIQSRDTHKETFTVQRIYKIIFQLQQSNNELFK